MRRFQAERLDAGWRIKLTRPKDKLQMGEVSGGIVPYLSIGGLVGFLTGFCLLAFRRHGNIELGLTLTSAGMLSMILSIILNAQKLKAQGRSWEVVPARCIDCELRRVSFERRRAPGYSWRWMCRVECEFNFAGQTYRVTPKVNWSEVAQSESSFPSEEKAQSFLEKRIGPNGECRLRVNPSNPVQTELIS